jgi:hypothetical protein
MRPAEPLGPSYDTQYRRLHTGFFSAFETRSRNQGYLLSLVWSPLTLRDLLKAPLFGNDYLTQTYRQSSQREQDTRYLLRQERPRFDAETSRRPFSNQPSSRKNAPIAHESVATRGNVHKPPRNIACCPRYPSTHGFGQPYTKPVSLAAGFVAVPACAALVPMASTSLHTDIQAQLLASLLGSIALFIGSLLWAHKRMYAFASVQINEASHVHIKRRRSMWTQDILSLVACITSASLVSMTLSVYAQPGLVLESTSMWCLSLVVLALWSLYPPTDMIVQRWWTILLISMVLAFAYACARIVHPVVGQYTFWVVSTQVCFVLYTLADSSNVSLLLYTLPSHWLAFRISLHIFNWPITLLLKCGDAIWR